MKIEILDFGLPKEYFPQRAHDFDSGADVFALQDQIIPAGRTMKIPLGFGVAIPHGYMGLVYPRSGLSSKGIDCLLPPIDSDYCGQIHAIVCNHSDEPYTINTGDRIGQLVITPIVNAEFVPEGSIKTRGYNGFGSTGV